VRSIRVRKGDTVKVVRGQNKGKTATVERVSPQYGKVYLGGIENVRKDGTKSLVAFQPSNVIITDLDLSDKKRAAKLKVKQNE